ncbi:MULTISPECIES: hypothetical protein [Sphingomonas]|uniref:Uncharacterized protein n=1 Tax=Sphingomonas zeae TaxID=1646122 RepID=A0A7Y6EE91_9SPHN|nr:MULTISPECIES: hypothetical protein [Sphingomonas]MBB4049597.1 hypothetical protein [Sphingomonas zeae]MDK8188030.1 hypothetical protein [Sphingomonas zeae]MDK8217902.1 hypothetical protein [Sphingomonas sp. UMB7805-LC452B]NUU45979.1 hypothetical protein [Sphingomonas zeae]
MRDPEPFDFLVKCFIALLLLFATLALIDIRNDIRRAPRCSASTKVAA